MMVCNMVGTEPTRPYESLVYDESFRLRFLTEAARQGKRS